MILHNDWEELKDSFYEMLNSICEYSERGMFDWDDIVSELEDEDGELFEEKLWNFFLKDNRVRTTFDDYDVRMDEEYAMNHEHDEEICGEFSNQYNYYDCKYEDNREWICVEIGLIDSYETTRLNVYVNKEWSDDEIENYVYENLIVKNIDRYNK